MIKNANSLTFVTLPTLAFRSVQQDSQAFKLLSIIIF